MISHMIVLFQNDGQPLPRWPQGVWPPWGAEGLATQPLTYIKIWWVRGSSTLPFFYPTIARCWYSLGCEVALLLKLFLNSCGAEGVHTQASCLLLFLPGWVTWIRACSFWNTNWNGHIPSSLCTWHMHSVGTLLRQALIRQSWRVLLGRTGI